MTQGNLHEFAYADFVLMLSEQLRDVQKEGHPVFCTGQEGCEDVYLSSFIKKVRQYHNCHACLDFLRRYGNLVFVKENTLHSVFWNSTVEEMAPPELRKAVRKLRAYVEKGETIFTIFADNRAILGRPITNTYWRHMWAGNIKPCLDRKAYQVQAAYSQALESLSRAVKEINPEDCRVVRKIIECTHRGQLFMDQLEWFEKAIQIYDDNKLLDLAAHLAKVPHHMGNIRNTVLFKALEAAHAGENPQTIMAQFNNMTDATVYQRPQAPAKSGTIVQAEQLFAELGFTKTDLARREMAFDELEGGWRPQQEKPPVVPETSIFAHLANAPRPVQTKHGLKLSHRTMSWRVFQRDILGECINLQISIEAGMPYCTLTTPAFPGTKPIFKTPQQMGWYFYTKPVLAREYNLILGRYTNVLGMTQLPLGQIMFILEGAKDQRSPAIGLFPELIRTELFGIRAVIEEYSKSKQLERIMPTRQSAAGVAYNIAPAANWNANLRIIFASGMTQEVFIDRYE